MSGDYHPLLHHCADVAACFEALLGIPSINKTMNRLGDFREGELPEVIKDRLSVLVFLHDIGKTALGFQYQVHSIKPVPPLPQEGHLRPIANLLWDGTGGNEWFYFALGFEEILSWSAESDYVTPSLIMASLAHHGKPLPCDEYAASSERRQWEKDDLLDPATEVQLHGEIIRQWFPGAFVKSSDQLPANTDFHHFFAGLVALADWIGSDRARFEYIAPVDGHYIDIARKKARDAVNAIGLNIVRQRLSYQPPPSVSGLFGFQSLRPLQQAVLDAPLSKNVLVLEAETGAGKTEAALLRFLTLYENDLVDGLYFAVPTRTAAIQLHRRINNFISKMLPNDSELQVVLAVPGYYQAGEAKGIPQPEFTVQWDDDPDASVAARRWAAENSKRYLAAQIAVGTVDQVMLSELPTKHSHMRSALLCRHLLVIDELHASDLYMRGIIQRVVSSSQLRSGHVLMMSATLGADARQCWLDQDGDSSVKLSAATAIKYPSLSYFDNGRIVNQVIEQTGGEKIVQIQAVVSADTSWLEMAIQAATDGAKVLVIRNTVDTAVSTLERLLEDDRLPNNLIFQINGVHTLHHSRFAAEDRKLLDAAVENWLGKERDAGGGIIVGTQTLEMSLDIDADILLTDLCPMDVLLQRIGRLHRHLRHNRPAGYQIPQVVVLTPDTEDLSKLLTRSESGLGPKAKVYPDIVVLQNTLELINRYPRWDLPAMNRLLVETALHQEARNLQLNPRDEAWQKAGNDFFGSQMADSQYGRMLKVEKGKLFTDNSVCFFDDKKVMTRLGGDNLNVTLEQSVEGPFGFPVKQFVIPDWLLIEPFSDYLEVNPEVIEGAGFLRLVFPNRVFLYGKVGLQVESE